MEVRVKEIPWVLLGVPEKCTDQITSSPELGAGGAVRAPELSSMFGWTLPRVQGRNFPVGKGNHFIRKTQENKSLGSRSWVTSGSFSPPHPHPPFSGVQHPSFSQRGQKSSATAGSRSCCLTTVSPICPKRICGPSRTQKFGSPEKRNLRVEMWAGGWERCPRGLESESGPRGKEGTLAGEVKCSSVRFACRQVGV